MTWQILFWSALGLILYTYVGYPLLLILFTAFKRKQGWWNPKHQPHVSIIISAFNEEEIIRDKIENTLNLQYPRNKLHIVVASDGSTDNTDKIVQEYAHRGVQLLRREKRAGKTSIQNYAVQKSDADVLVFSDANAMYQSDAIQKLVRHFADERVGCVCGELTYWNRNGSVAGNEESLYWAYEKFLKRQENDHGMILGANGSIYAVRRDCYVPLAANLISDFIEPLKIAEKGYRVLYEPEALSFEQSSHSFYEEFRRKKRIILRSVFSIFKNLGLLNVFRRPMLSFQLISHKLLRWAVPVFLLTMLIANLALLSKPFYFYFLLSQILFYLLAVAGYYLEKKNIKGLIIYIPYYFILVNIASFLAILEFFRGRNVVLWQPVRKQEQQSTEQNIKSNP